MLQAASSALFSTSTPVWTMRGVYRVIDKMQHKHFQKCLADILILDLHVLTSSHGGGAHNAGPQMMCAATFHALQ